MALFLRVVVLALAVGRGLGLCLRAAGSYEAAPFFRAAGFAYTSKAAADGTREVTLDYESASAAYAEELITRPVPPVDFVVTSKRPSDELFAAQADLRAYPFLVQAQVPVYNVPELQANLTEGSGLVLSLSLLASIYLGDIEYWNDTSIKAVQADPAVAAALPFQRINVITRLDEAGATDTITRAMSLESADFALRVGATPSPDWCEGEPYDTVGGGSGSYDAHVDSTERGGGNAGVMRCQKAIHGGRVYSFQRARGLPGVVGALRAANYSIAFTSFDAVRLYGLVAAQMQVPGSRIIEAEARTMRGGVSTEYDKFNRIELTSLGSRRHWPFLAFQYILLRLEDASRDCTQRRDLVHVLSFFLDNLSLRDQARDDGVVMLRPQIAGSMISEIEAILKCYPPAEMNRTTGVPSGGGCCNGALISRTPAFSYIVPQLNWCDPEHPGNAATRPACNGGIPAVQLFSDVIITTGEVAAAGVHFNTMRAWSLAFRQHNLFRQWTFNTSFPDDGAALLERVVSGRSDAALFDTTNLTEPLLAMSSDFVVMPLMVEGVAIGVHVPYFATETRYNVSVGGTVQAAYDFPLQRQYANITLSGAVLADIYLGNIVLWSDERIRSLCAAPSCDNPSLPAQPIRVVLPYLASRETELFTAFLSRASPAWASLFGVRSSLADPTLIARLGGRHLVAPSIVDSEPLVEHQHFSVGFFLPDRRDVQVTLASLLIGSNATGTVLRLGDSSLQSCETGGRAERGDGGFFYDLADGGGGEGCWPVARALALASRRSFSTENADTDFECDGTGGGTVDFMTWAYSDIGGAESLVNGSSPAAAMTTVTGEAFARLRGGMVCETGYLMALEPFEQPVEPDNRSISGFTTQVCLIMGVVGSVVAVCFALLTLRWSKMGVHSIRLAQPFFLIVLCFGCVPAFLAIIIRGMLSDSGAAELDTMHLNIKCNVFWWLHAVAFAMTYGALFAKTMRIMAIWRAALAFKSAKITPLNVSVYIIGIFLVDALILFMWEVVSPLRYSREATETDSFGRVTETVGRCRSDMMGYFVGALAGFHIAILCVSNFVCYQTRSLLVNFSDAGGVSVGISNHLQILIFSIPILFILSDEPDQYVIMESLMMFINYCVLLFVIFVPKVYAVVTGRDAEGGSTIKSSENKAGSKLTSNSLKQSAGSGQAPPEARRIMRVESNKSKRVHPVSFSASSANMTAPTSTGTPQYQYMGIRGSDTKEGDSTKLFTPVQPVYGARAQVPKTRASRLSGGSRSAGPE